MVEEIRQEKDEAVQRLREEKDFLAREIKTQEDLIAEKDTKIKTLEENNSVLNASSFQLTDLRNEYQAVHRDHQDMQQDLTAARARLAEVEEELASSQKSGSDQMNELRYQLVHAKADKEELLSKAEHDKAKMYGILKELEAQLREATGGEPTANLAKMMGEFTDTMGSGTSSAQVSDGTLYATMREYEEKLAQAQAD